MVGGRREGDAVGPLVKGPLTVTDMICWHVGMGMGLYGVKALRLAARNRRRIPRFFHRDDDNVPDVMQRVHWDPDFAKRSGNPTTFDYGRMRETWLIHLCTDWMGDDAWLWKLDCEFRLFNYVGDTQWVQGTVTRKYLADGDQPAVDLDVACTNQRGEVTTPGHATILLPSPRARRRAPARPAGGRPAGRPRGDRGPLGGPMSIASAEEARAWVADHVPAAWRQAAAEGQAIREVRTFAEYEAWYPTFAASGLAVPTWPVAYGGLDLDVDTARAIEQVLAPYNLGRLNPLGLNLCAPALFAHGSEEQRLRYLPRIVDNTEVWAQLFSEPGAGSDLASLAPRAERDGDELGAVGPEGVDDLGPHRRLGRVPGPHRRRRPQARRDHLLPRRPPCPRRDGPAAAPHRRGGRLQRGVPRRGPRARRPAGRRRGRRLEGGQRHPLR